VSVMTSHYWDLYKEHGHKRVQTFLEKVFCTCNHRYSNLINFEL